MKLPDEALALLVRQWIAKAEVNYRLAKRTRDAILAQLDQYLSGG
jgi:hypothetical protein